MRQPAVDAVEQTDQDVEMLRLAMEVDFALEEAYAVLRGLGAVLEAAWRRGLRRSAGRPLTSRRAASRACSLGLKPSSAAARTSRTAASSARAAATEISAGARIAGTGGPDAARTELLPMPAMRKWSRRPWRCCRTG